MDLYLCSETKGADQLLCIYSYIFSHIEKSRFFDGVDHIQSDQSICLLSL